VDGGGGLGGRDPWRLLNAGVEQPISCQSEGSTSRPVVAVGRSLPPKTHPGSTHPHSDVHADPEAVPFLTVSGQAGSGSDTRLPPGSSSGSQHGPLSSSGPHASYVVADTSDGQDGTSTHAHARGHAYGSSSTPTRLDASTIESPVSHWDSRKRLAVHRGILAPHAVSRSVSRLAATPVGAASPSALDVKMQRSASPVSPRWAQGRGGHSERAAVVVTSAGVDAESGANRVLPHHLPGLVVASQICRAMGGGLQLWDRAVHALEAGLGTTVPTGRAREDGDMHGSSRGVTKTTTVSVLDMSSSASATSASSLSEHRGCRAGQSSSAPTSAEVKVEGVGGSNSEGRKQGRQQGAVFRLTLPALVPSKQGALEDASCMGTDEDAPSGSVAMALCACILDALFRKESTSSRPRSRSRAGRAWTVGPRSVAASTGAGAGSSWQQQQHRQQQDSSLPMQDLPTAISTSASEARNETSDSTGLPSIMRSSSALASVQLGISLLPVASPVHGPASAATASHIHPHLSTLKAPAISSGASFPSPTPHRTRQAPAQGSAATDFASGGGVDGAGALQCGTSLSSWWRGAAAPRVLVVDDERTNRRLLHRMLMRCGVQDADIDEADDGSTAVSAWRSSVDQGRPYDVVCLDIVMVQMDGEEALQQILFDCEGEGGSASAARRPLCLACTGNASASDRARYLGSGFDVVLAKPFGCDDLLDCLSLCIASAHHA